MEYEIVFITVAIIATFSGITAFSALTSSEPVDRKTFGWVTVVLFITERTGSALVAQMLGWNISIILSLFMTAIAMHFFGRLAGGYALYLEKKLSWGLWVLVPFGWFVMLFAKQPEPTCEAI